MHLHKGVFYNMTKQWSSITARVWKSNDISNRKAASVWRRNQNQHSDSILELQITSKVMKKSSSHFKMQKKDWNSCTIYPTIKSHNKNIIFNAYQVTFRILRN